MKKNNLIIVVCLCLNVVAFKTSAQTTDDVLNLLISKNLIQQQDADSIRAEFAIKQQEAKEKQKAFNVTTKRALQLSGYTQIRYQTFNEAGKADGVDIRRARLDFRGTINPIWDYRLQLEFATSPKILDAYASYKPLDYFKVQLGQFKVPFSIENLAQSNNMETIDRSQVVEALVARGKDIVGNQNGRDIGIQLYGSLLKQNDRFMVDYYLAAFNGAGINAVDNNENKDLSGRLVIHPIPGLDIGGAVYAGIDTIAINPARKQVVRNRFGGELSYTWKNLTIKGEYIEGKDDARKKFGYYAQAGYFVFPKKLQIIAKYDSYDPNKDKEDDDTIWYIGGANYFFNDFVKIAVNYTYKTEKVNKKNDDIIAAQFQIAF